MNSQNWLIRFSNWLLRKIYDDQLYDEIEGDLFELYNQRLTSIGRTKASLLYLWDAILSIRNIGLKKKKEFGLNRIDMLRGYFKVGYRHLMKSKSYSLINIFGLAVGITAFFLISQYISFELNYDQFHVNKESIYRISMERSVNGESTGTTRTFFGMRRLLKENFPEIENITSFMKIPANTGFLFRYNGKIYNEPGGVINPDSTFFKVFPSLLVKGDAATAVKNIGNIVLSESMANKIFGSVDPIGKNLERIDDHSTSGSSDYFVVTGVLKDIPENSHFHASFIPAVDVDEFPDTDDWSESYLFTYITLYPGTDVEKITERINQLLKQVGESSPNVKGARAFLQPITDIHLSSQYKDEF